MDKKQKDEKQLDLPMQDVTASVNEHRFLPPMGVPGMGLPSQELTETTGDMQSKIDTVKTRIKRLQSIQNAILKQLDRCESVQEMFQCLDSVSRFVGR